MDPLCPHRGSVSYFDISVCQKIDLSCIGADMEFVKNFTHPDFQAKSFTPQKCVICDSFFSQINSVNASNINNLGIFWL